MSRLIDSFWRAAVYCLHPRVIALSFLPLIIMTVASLGLGYLYWNDAVDTLRTQLDSYQLVSSMSQWLEGLGLGNLRLVLAPAFFATRELLGSGRDWPARALWKCGQAETEMNLYRYDLVLGPDPKTAPEDAAGTPLEVLSAAQALAAADLSDRQWWWLYAVCFAAAGFVVALAALRFLNPAKNAVEDKTAVRRIWLRRNMLQCAALTFGMLLAAIPHLSGAPHPYVGHATDISTTCGSDHRECDRSGPPA